MQNNLTNQTFSLAVGQKLAYDIHLNNFLVVNPNQPLDPNVTTNLSVITRKINQFLSSDEYNQSGFKEKFFVSANINVLNQVYRRYNAKIESNLLLNIANRVLSIFNCFSPRIFGLGITLSYNYIRNGGVAGRNYNIGINHRNTFTVEESIDLLNFARNNRTALNSMDLIRATLQHIKEIDADNQNFLYELVCQTITTPDLWAFLIVRSSDEALISLYEYVLLQPIQGTPSPIRIKLFSLLCERLLPNFRFRNPDLSARKIAILEEEFKFIDHRITILQSPHLVEAAEHLDGLTEQSRGIFCDIFSNIRDLEEKIKQHPRIFKSLYLTILREGISDQGKPFHDKLFTSILKLLKTPVDNVSNALSDSCAELVAQEYSNPTHCNALLSTPEIIFKGLANFRQLGPGVRGPFFEALNGMASNEQHWDNFKKYIIRSPANQANILSLYRYIMSESVGAYLQTAIHKKLFSLLTTSYFTNPADVTFLVVEEFTKAPSHKERLTQEFPSLITNAINGLIADRTKHKTCIDLFNSLNEIPEDFWKQLENQSGAQLDRLYEDILHQSSAPNYIPTNLHKKLFSRFLKSNPNEQQIFSTVSIEYTFADHRDQMKNSITGIIGLALLFIDAPHLFLTDSRDETRDEIKATQAKVLKNLLVSFQENKVVSSSLLARYIQLLDGNGIFNLLWKQVPADIRVKIMQKISKPPLDSHDRQLCNALFRSYKEQYFKLDSKQFGEQHPLEKEAFFGLAIVLQKVKEIPQGLLTELTRYLARPSVGKELLMVINANALPQFLHEFLSMIKNEQEIPPRYLIALFYNFRGVPSFSILNFQPQYDIVFKYLVQLKMEKEPYSKALQTIYHNSFNELNSEEKDVYFSLVVSADTLGVISFDKLADFLRYLVKTKNRKLDLLLQVFFILKQNKTEKIPSLLILEFLHITLDIEFSYTSLQHMHDEHLKDLLKHLEELDLLEVPGKEIDLSLTAVYVCSLAVERYRKEKEVIDSVKSVMSRVNMSRVPKPLFKDKICPRVGRENDEIWTLNDLIQEEPDTYLCSGDEDLWIEYYSKLESDFKINWEHLVVAQQQDTPPPPLPNNVSVNYDEIITMFGRINFTDPRAPGYVNPDTLEDDGARVSVDSLRQGIRSYVNKIQNGPSYAPANAQERQLWLQNLDRWVKHSILILRNRPEKDRSIFLIWLAGAGLHCGGKMYTTAQDMYSQLAEARVLTAGERLTDFVSTTLAKRRLNILDMEFNLRAGNDPQTTHIWAHTMRNTGGPFGAFGWKVYDYRDALVAGSTRPLCQNHQQVELLRICKGKYNPTLIINELYSQLNGIGRARGVVGGNSEFRTDSIEAWFNGNFPAALKQKFLQERDKNVQLVDRIRLREKVLKAHNEKKFKELLAEEYRILKCGVDNTVSLNLEAVFLEDYLEQNPYATESQAVQAAFDHFKNGNLNEIVTQKQKKQIRDQIEQEMKFKDERDFSKEVSARLNKEMQGVDREYYKTLMEQDEFNGAVLEEIYYVDLKGRKILKRKWLVYLLMHVSLGDRNCSVLDPRISKLGIEKIPEKGDASKVVYEIHPDTGNSCQSDSSSGPDSRPNNSI